MSGNLSHPCRSLYIYSDPLHIVLPTMPRGAQNSALPQSYWISIQHPVYGFPRISLLGSSVNRGNANVRWRRVAASSSMNANSRKLIISERLRQHPSRGARLRPSETGYVLPMVDYVGGGQPYSPNRREGVFSESELPEFSLLGNHRSG